jgi:transposase InsO family protein
MKKYHRVAPEVKEQILRRIKEEGVSVAEAAKDAGIHETTIYDWLGKGLKGRAHHRGIGEIETPERGASRSRGRAHAQELPSPKKELVKQGKHTKAALAARLRVSRSSLYYISEQLPKDWTLKNCIEEVMAKHPGYGSPRIALALRRNRKAVSRVMHLFGLKAYRRRGKRPRKKGYAQGDYPNLLKTVVPARPHHVWVADFTYIPYQGKFLYLATVMDIVTREIVGMAMQTRHGAMLVIQALFAAVEHHTRPAIFHSDNGREYEAKIFIAMLERYGIVISRSRPGSPWENGYQESFYGKFKMDLGDPNRVITLGELVAEIYRTVREYNHTRNHSALKMPPSVFAEKIAT